MNKLLIAVAALALLGGIACGRQSAPSVVSGPDVESVQSPQRAVQFEPSVIVAHARTPASRGRAL